MTGASQEKLVRDYIPEIMRAAGVTPEFRTAAPEELKDLLVAKLCEEAAELAQCYSIDEMVDVVEVLDAIMRVLNVSGEALMAARHAKASMRGGFERGIVLRV